MSTQRSTIPFFTFAIFMLLMLASAGNSHAQKNPAATLPDKPNTVKKTAENTKSNAATTEPQSDSLPNDTAENSDSIDKNKPALIPLGPGQSYSQTPSREQKLLQDFTQGPLGSGESMLLNANDEAFITLWRSDTSGSPKGAALILPDEQINLLENQSIQNIQIYLSQHGWSTLTIALPQTYTAPPPPASPIIEVKKAVTPEPATEDAAEAPSKTEADVVYEDDKNAPESETPKSTKTDADTDINPPATAAPEPPPPVEPIAQARLQAALDFLQQKGQKNIVVIAQGVSSARALFYLAQTISDDDSDNPSSINALIMLDANLHIAELGNWDAYGVIAKLNMPALDIVHAPYSRSPTMAATITSQKRREAAQVGKVPIYQQRELLPATLANEEMRITRVIRGFLKKYLETPP